MFELAGSDVKLELVEGVVGSAQLEAQPPAGSIEFQCMDIAEAFI